VVVNHANEIIHQEAKVIGIGRGMTNNWLHAVGETGSGWL
jgi:hypothetical protein